jgi:hypothetical protein
MLKHELTCKERVADELADRLNDIKTANLFFSSLENIKRKAKNKAIPENFFKIVKNLDLRSYESMTEFLNSYSLSFDLIDGVQAEQENSVNYWRWQLSWGGPSDEFRIFWNLEKGIYKIEYWFLDWYDGAKITLHDGYGAHNVDFSLLRRIIYNEYFEPFMAGFMDAFTDLQS